MYKSRWYPELDFKCKCKYKCGLGYAQMSEQHLRNLDAICDLVGFKVPISSAIRCKKHNTDVGGGDNSQHLIGNATDHPVSYKQAYQVVKAAMKLGLAVGIKQKGTNRFVHIDSRIEILFTY